MILPKPSRCNAILTRLMGFAGARFSDCVNAPREKWTVRNNLSGMAFGRQTSQIGEVAITRKSLDMAAVTLT